MDPFVGLWLLSTKVDHLADLAKAYTMMQMSVEKFYELAKVHTGGPAGAERSGSGRASTKPSAIGMMAVMWVSGPYT